MQNLNDFNYNLKYIIAEDKETADNISEYKSQSDEKNSNSQFEKQPNSLREDYKNSGRKQLRKSSSNIPITFPNTSPKFLNTNQAFLNEEDENIDEVDGEIAQDEQREEQLKNAMITGDWNKNSERCYVTKEKIHLKDVTFNTLENNILAQNHIILCGAVDNFINFITPLRAKYLEKYPAIVLLNEIEPTEKAWNLVSLFPDIYYVKGTSLNERDLIRANIEKASTIVILASELESNSNDSYSKNDDDYPKKSMELSKEQEDLLDAKTIFKYKAVQRIKPNIQIVTEFVNPQNIAFLSSDLADYALMKKFGYNHTPLFASGEIYISSIMDSLSCQAYYNPALIKVLNLLLLGDSSHSQHQKKKKSEFSFNTKNSNLFHIKIPKAFLGKTFENLFGFLSSKQDVIALGLYRLPFCKDNKMPYVWTNPDPETILTEKDLCFILAQNPPTDNYMEWGGPLEKNENQKKKRKFRNQTSDSTQSETDDIPLNYDEVERTNANTRQYIKDSELVNQKINQIAEKIVQIKENSKILEEMISKRQDELIESLKGVVQEEFITVIKQKQQIQQQTLLLLQQQQQPLASMQQQSEEQNQLSDQSSLPPEDYEQELLDQDKKRLFRNN